jgi:hypothetical protein
MVNSKNLSIFTNKISIKYSGVSLFNLRLSILNLIVSLSKDNVVKSSSTLDNWLNCYWDYNNSFKSLSLNSNFNYLMDFKIDLNYENHRIGQKTSVLTSPHVDKLGQEQFEYRDYSALVTITVNGKLVDNSPLNFIKYFTLDGFEHSNIINYLQEVLSTDTLSGVTNQIIISSLSLNSIKDNDLFLYKKLF